MHAPLLVLLEPDQDLTNIMDFFLEPDDDTDNPNAAYDYYLEGGRYAGFLTLKDGSKATRAKVSEVDWVNTPHPYCLIPNPEYLFVSDSLEVDDDEEWLSFLSESIQSDAVSSECEAVIMDIHN